MPALTAADVTALPGGALVANRRLYLSRDGRRVVGEGDPDALILLAPAGVTLDPVAIAAHGLTLAAAKMVDGPPADKARRARATKARP